MEYQVLLSRVRWSTSTEFQCNGSIRWKRRYVCWNDSKWFIGLSRGSSHYGLLWDCAHKATGVPACHYWDRLFCALLGCFYCKNTEPSHWTMRFSSDLNNNSRGGCKNFSSLLHTQVLDFLFCAPCALKNKWAPYSFLIRSLSDVLCKKHCTFVFCPSGWVVWKWIQGRVRVNRLRFWDFYISDSPSIQCDSKYRWEGHYYHHLWRISSGEERHPPNSVSWRHPMWCDVVLIHRCRRGPVHCSSSVSREAHCGGHSSRCVVCWICLMWRKDLAFDATRDCICREDSIPIHGRGVQWLRQECVTVFSFGFWPSRYRHPNALRRCVCVCGGWFRALFSPNPSVLSAFVKTGDMMAEGTLSVWSLYVHFFCTLNVSKTRYWV